jgi:formylglycine-generating enzyme required for sulfatase activity
LSLLAVLLVLTLCTVGCRREPERGPQVTVVTEPVSGATVRVGATVVGETPVTFEPTRRGTLVVTLEREGYKEAVELVEVPAEGDVHLEVRLVPRVGYVSITSEPSGAAILLDGRQLIGRTPLVEYSVPVGHHVFTLQKQQYRSATQEATVEEDFRYSFRHDLEPEPSTLTVFSRPTGAQIWIDGVEQDKTAPAVFEMLAGTYTVALSSKGYLPYERIVTLEAAQALSIDAELVEGEAPPGMLLVPAGEFLFGLDGGSPDQRPQQKVLLEAFYIDRTEVTNKDFQTVFPTHRFPEEHDAFPVTGVTYKQAEAYALAIGKRLPTEQEWEKAARSTDGRLYPWGNTWNADFCNSGATEGPVLRRVGLYREGASPYGCLDMAGNAYEWTSSWYQAYPGNTGIRAEYGQVFKVLRGGSYQSELLDVRTTSRFYDRLDASRSDYGFRCAADVVQASRPSPSQN